MMRLLVICLCFGFAARSYALSIKCTTTRSLTSVKEVVVQNAKASTAAKNENAFILLDGKRKIGGVSSFNPENGFIKYSANEGKFIARVSYYYGNDPQETSIVEIQDGPKADIEKIPFDCKKIEDTRAEIKNKAEVQKVENRSQLSPEPRSPFCKLDDLTSVSQIKNWIKEEPTITREGDFNILKYPSGAVVKSKVDFGNIDSFTLPPNVNCK